MLFVHVDYLSLCCEYDRMEKGEADNRDEVMEKYRRLYTCLKDNNLTNFEIMESVLYNIPDQIEYDKKPCKSWYKHDYMTVAN